MKSETNLFDGHRRNYQRINKVSSSTYFTFILHPSETFHDNHSIFFSSAARARQMMIYLYLYDKEIFVIHTCIVGGIVAHYHILNEKPKKKFVELNNMTGDFNFVDGVGTNPHSIYILYRKIDQIYS